MWAHSDGIAGLLERNAQPSSRTALAAVGAADNSGHTAQGSSMQGFARWPMQSRHKPRLAPCGWWAVSNGLVSRVGVVNFAGFAEVGLANQCAAQVGLAVTRPAVA